MLKMFVQNCLGRREMLTEWTVLLLVNKGGLEAVSCDKVVCENCNSETVDQEDKAD